MRTPLYFDEVTLHVATETAPLTGERPQLWPSLGEYPCYDPFLYGAMTGDVVRNRQFESALKRLAAGRFVLDLGTGRDLNWALSAAGLGARRVVAVEGIPESYLAARATLAERAEADAIELVHGFAEQVRLDERAEVCVAEVIGSIASAEGILEIVSDARGRLLTDDAVLVPHRCTTEVGAIGLREVFGGAPLAFAAEAVPYLGQVFELYGAPFDVRLTVAAVPPQAVLSTTGTVEDLPFNDVPRWPASTDVRLRIARDGVVDGLLFWITLIAYADAEVIDTMHRHTSWRPVYLPLFDDPVPVHAGDTLDVHFVRSRGDDGTHPDYSVAARLRTVAGTTTGSVVSRHHGGGAGGTAVHRELYGLATTVREGMR